MLLASYTRLQSSSYTRLCPTVASELYPGPAFVCCFAATTWPAWHWVWPLNTRTEPFSAAEYHVVVPSLPADTDLFVDRSHSNQPDAACVAVTVNVVARPYGKVEEAINSVCGVLF